jgi:WS/DGAT/MGAT family acyltransferase
MPDHITAVDGTFLELEDANSAAHMHIGALLVFAPRPHAGTPSVEEVRTFLDERLDVLPRYRQRLAGPTAGGLGWQRWVDDEHFDVGRHVRGATLTPPGGLDELLEWASDYYSLRLERSMPLWEVVVVDGLADGRWALATKTHHCLVDGVGSVDAAYLLLDDVAEALAAAPADDDSVHERFGFARRIVPDRLAHGAGVVLHGATHPRELVRRTAALAELLVRDEVKAAPETSLNEAICARRVVRSVTVELDDVKQIRRALGGTVNDVVLAAVAAGLRDVLVGRGEPVPEQGLRAMVPMNIRRDDEHGGALGNRISSLFIDLPVAEPHPIARYEKIRELTDATKGSSQALGSDTLLRVAGIAPPVIHHLLAQSLFAKRLFNVTITNVPGPQQPLTAFGAPLEMVWPLVPLAADHTVGVAIVSYNGRLCFGVNADRDSMSDVGVLVAGIEQGIGDLLAVAEASNGALSG